LEHAVNPPASSWHSKPATPDPASEPLNENDVSGPVTGGAGASDVVGAVESSRYGKGAEHGDVSGGIVAVAKKLVVVSSATDACSWKLPEASAVVVPTGVPPRQLPLTTSTVAPASAVPLKTGLLLSAGEVGVLPVIVGVLTTATAEGMPTAKAANATAIAHVAIRIRVARRDETLSPGG